VTSFQSTESTGNVAGVSFFRPPFINLPGLKSEMQTAGRTILSTARFSGTCAGVTVAASSPSQNGNMQTHTGNTTQTITMVP